MNAFDVYSQLIGEASDRRRQADAGFRAALVAARAAGMPLTRIAEAADLSIGRVHAILQEEEQRMHTALATPDSAPTAATDDVVVVAARVAYEEWIHYGAYVCQQGRTFREAHRMGFYRHGNIERHFPSIRAIEDNILFTRENAEQLRTTGSPIDREVADLIDTLLDHHKRYEGLVYEVVLLTQQDDPQTLTLDRAIRHNGRGRGGAWTMGQRYASEAAIRRGPATTDEL
jgi:hypothetical protein